MSVPLLGLLMLAVAAVLFFYDSKYLLCYTVLLSPLQSSSVLNLGSAGIMPAIFTGILFIIRYLFERGQVSRFEHPRGSRLLFAFVAVSFLSILLGAAKNSLVPNPESAAAAFSARTVTQFLYIAFCYAFYYFLYSYLHDRPESVSLLLKLQFTALVIAILYGYYQFVSRYVGTWFSSLVENRAGVAITHVYFGRFRRIQSFALEPSMFAFYLVPALALYYRIYRGWRSSVVLLAGVLAGVLSFSTSFMVGLLVFLMTEVFERPILGSRSQRSRKVALLAGMVVVLGLVYLEFSTIINTFVSLAVGKLRLQSQSGQVRFLNLNIGIAAFREFPLFGIGFGAIRTTDLFSTFLANVGVIGSLIFWTFVGSLWWKARKVNPRSVTLAGLTQYVLIQFGIAFVSVPEPYYVFMWINVALIDWFAARGQSTAEGAPLAVAG